MMRPQPAVWFEIIATAKGTREVLESLAATGCAEMEATAKRQASGAEQAIFARITGWTSDAARLAACLARSHVPAVVHFPKAPEELLPPLILRTYP